jgi:tryptophan synthase alpha subunit
MNITLKKFKKEEKQIPYILLVFEKEVKNKYDKKFFSDLEQKLFKIYNEETLIPEKFRTLKI